MRKILALTAASGLALTGIVALAPAASAKDGDVKMRQSCTGGDSFSVVKVKDRKGGLRTDFWVKNNTVGQAWNFTLTQGGEPMASVSKTTRASDDDVLLVRRHPAHRRGEVPHLPVQQTGSWCSRRRPVTRPAG